MPKKKKNIDLQIQYYAKIAGALNNIFDPESEFFIDIRAKDFDFNYFIHVLATRVPQMVFAKLSSKEFDMVEFKHLCNKLIIQDQIEKVTESS